MVGSESDAPPSVRGPHLVGRRHAPGPPAQPAAPKDGLVVPGPGWRVEEPPDLSDLTGTERSIPDPSGRHTSSGRGHAWASRPARCPLGTGGRGRQLCQHRGKNLAEGPGAQVSRGRSQPGGGVTARGAGVRCRHRLCPLPAQQETGGRASSALRRGPLPPFLSRVFALPRRRRAVCTGEDTLGWRHLGGSA